MGSKKIVTKIKDALSRGSRSPSPEPGPSTRASTNVDSPFTRFVLSNLDEQDHKMVAMAFAPHIQTDCDARNLDFDDFFHLLGHTSKRDAVRTLKRAIPEGELVLGTSAQNSTGRPRDVYIISVNQFEEVLLAANTETGKKWRKLVLKIKNLVVQYMKMEMDANASRAQLQLEDQMARLAARDGELAVVEQEKTMLATQLKNLREAKSYLYAFWLFDNRYKCGITDNPEKREKQHQTSCPSGRMIYFVVIACKQSEKLLDSIMKSHGSHIRQEEYDIEGGEARVCLILNTIARVEESLHSVPFDRYRDLLKSADETLGNGTELVADTQTCHKCRRVLNDANTNVYHEFITTFLEVTANKDDRIIQAEVERGCAEWLKDRDVPSNFEKKALKNALTNAGAVFKESVRFLMGQDANRKSQYCVRQGYENIRYKNPVSSSVSCR